MTENDPINKWDRLGLKSCESAGGKVKSGKCCCGGKEMNPSSECCEGGSIKNQKICYQFIFLGHGSNVDFSKDFFDKLPANPKENVNFGCVTCFSNQNNARIEEKYPDNHIPDIPGTNVTINAREMWMLFEKIKIHINKDEIKARLCKPCCSKLSIKVKCHDDVKAKMRPLGDTAQNPCSKKFKKEYDCD